MNWGDTPKEAYFYGRKCGIRDGRAEERAAIVAAMRETIARMRNQRMNTIDQAIVGFMTGQALRYERGEHVSDSIASPDAVISDNRSCERLEPDANGDCQRCDKGADYHRYSDDTIIAPGSHPAPSSEPHRCLAYTSNGDGTVTCGECGKPMPSVVMQQLADSEALRSNPMPSKEPTRGCAGPHCNHREWYEDMRNEDLAREGTAKFALGLERARAERLEAALREILKRAEVVDTAEEITSVAERALSSFRMVEPARCATCDDKPAIGRCTAHPSETNGLVCRRCSDSTCVIEPISAVEPRDE